MFRRYLLTPCEAPPDGAGGGAASAAPSAGAPAGGAAGTGGSAHDDNGNDDGGDDGGDLDQDTGDGDGGDDDDEELSEREALLDALPVEEREKRVRTWNRATSRKLKKLAPIAELMRGPDGRFLPPHEVQKMRQDATDMRELNAFFAEHPDVVQQILERKKGSAGTGQPPASTYQDPYADEEKLPLNMQDEAARFVVQQLRNLDKTNHDLREELAALKGVAGTIQQNDVQRSMAAVENHWKTSTQAEARRQGLDERQTAMFINSVWKTFELAKAQKILKRVDMKQVFARELKLLGVSRRRTVADTARRAERVTQIPRPAGRGQTAATTATDTNKNAGTIKDARKSFFTRLGQSATPR
jgi:hypothetical protein